MFLRLLKRHKYPRYLKTSWGSATLLCLSHGVFPLLPLKFRVSLGSVPPRPNSNIMMSYRIVSRCLKHIDEPAGKAAVIWMVGEYGEEITVRGQLLKLSRRSWTCWWMLGVGVFTAPDVCLMCFLVVARFSSGGTGTRCRNGPKSSRSVPVFVCPVSIEVADGLDLGCVVSLLTSVGFDPFTATWTGSFVGLHWVGLVWCCLCLSGALVPCWCLPFPIAFGCLLYGRHLVGWTADQSHHAPPTKTAEIQRPIQTSEATRNQRVAERPEYICWRHVM